VFPLVMALGAVIGILGIPVRRSKPVLQCRPSFSG
jgi:hypothetical protein